LRANTEALTDEIEKLDAEAGDSLEHAKAYKEKVIALMQTIREDADKLETQVDAELWPLPTYGDLLFKV
jgi:glutamine synthetase